MMFYTFQSTAELSDLQSVTVDLLKVIGVSHYQIVGVNVVEVILDNGYAIKVMTYKHLTDEDAKRFHKDLVKALQKRGENA